MDNNKNEIRKENIEQNNWTPENKISMAKMHCSWSNCSGCWSLCICSHNRSGI